MLMHCIFSFIFTESKRAMYQVGANNACMLYIIVSQRISVEFSLTLRQSMIGDLP